MPVDADDSPGFLLWQVTLRWQRDIATALAPLDLTHVQFIESWRAERAWADHRMSDHVALRAFVLPPGQVAQRTRQDGFSADVCLSTWIAVARGASRSSSGTCSRLIRGFVGGRPSLLAGRRS